MPKIYTRITTIILFVTFFANHHTKIYKNVDAFVPENPPTPQHLRRKLTYLQYDVTQTGINERPKTGKYWNSIDKGLYHCVVCNTELFNSVNKTFSLAYAAFIEAKNVAEFEVDRQS